MIAAGVDPVAAVDGWPMTRWLRAALRANAVFSLGSGLVLAVGGAFVARPWGLGPAVLPPAVGVAVAVFGVLVAWLAVQPVGGLRRGAILVVAADAVWVLGSVALFALYPLSGPVVVVVAAVAVVVAGLAVWQVAEWAAVRTGDPLADVDVVQASRILPAPPAQVWPLLTDHDLYGRLAPNLSRVEVISDADEPLRRRCTNTTGRSWEETCTLWQDGRRYAVEVDTADYPYPLILMRGLWQVDPHPAGSRVTMRFAFQAAPTITGGLFAIAFRALFAPILGRLFRGWQRRLPAPGQPDRP